MKIKNQHKDPNFLISLFINGEANENEKQDFFSMLNNNLEFQNEFKEMYDTHLKLTQCFDKIKPSFKLGCQFQKKIESKDK